MKKLSIVRTVLLATSIVVFSFAASTLSAESKKPVKPRSYLELASTGKLSIVPYVWERRTNGKHIVVIGTRHIRNPRSPMYDRIESIFKRVKPQLVIHENVAPPALSAMTRDQAIEAGADLGFSVHAARKYGASIRSGDASVQDEFKSLLAHYPPGDVLVFVTAQRLIGSNRKPSVKSIVAEYPSFFENYLARNGIPKRQGFETWDGFLREYKRVMGRPFSRDSWNPDFINPTLNTGRLSEIARNSDALRDRYLLASIKKALQEQDRVVVVFGGWHVLALEPELDNLLAR